MKANLFIAFAATAAFSSLTAANDAHSAKQVEISDQVIAEQRIKLSENTEGQGFGPQSPRNIESVQGDNAVVFATAPAYHQMNLCNIHFHKNAEHAGGEFAQYAGHGDGHGFQSGYKYSGELSKRELTSVDFEICPSSHGSLLPGDTIEVHYVHSSAQIQPGPSLGACLSKSIKNPQLRVEAQVYVLVNDSNALNFMDLTMHEKVNNLHQAVNIPNHTGKAVEYAGSTTGPSYNEAGSPLQVTWNVRPKVAKVDINSVGEWCQGNVFKEDHAHGVRNLVTNPDLLSPITK